MRLAGGDVGIVARFVTPVRTSRQAKDAVLPAGEREETLPIPSQG